MQVYFNNEKFTLNENESVLECLLREQQMIPYSCKTGICQSCIMQAKVGDVPEKAQQGLKPTLKQQKLFLACQCYPDNDITVQLPDEANLRFKASIVEINTLNHNVLQLRLRPEESIECKPGQFITLINNEQVARSYSIANQPANDGYIELHIRIIKGGKMSVWLQEKARIGDRVILQGPAGYCFYTAQDGNEYPIVLAGTGTGLAPLYGIVVDALEQNHQGNICLYHGAITESDLYFIDELKNLAAENDNFTYTACVLNGKEEDFYQIGNIEDIVMANMFENKATTRLYLCGAPELVNSLKTKAFITGLSSKHIYMDAFLPSKP